MTEKERLLDMLKSAIDRNEETTNFCVMVYNTETLSSRVLKYGNERLDGLYKYIKKRFDDYLMHKKKKIMITSCCISNDSITDYTDIVALKLNESYILYGADYKI